MDALTSGCINEQEDSGCCACARENDDRAQRESRPETDGHDAQSLAVFRTWYVSKMSEQLGRWSAREQDADKGSIELQEKTDVF